MKDCGVFLVSNDIIPHAVRSEQVEYRFNLSTVARTEKILTAELHLFKLRPQATVTFNRHHFCQVCTVKCNQLNSSMKCSESNQMRLCSGHGCDPPHLCCLIQVSVYQLLDPSRSNNTQEKKLLSSRLIPVHSAGWEVFTITQAVGIHFS